MKRMFWTMSAALVATAISPSIAQDNAEKPKEEKKVCRSQGAQTGSILGAKRVCHTKQEWAKIEEANARNTDRALEARRTSSAPIGR